jgi:ribose transport system ATP-binding protein
MADLLLKVEGIEKSFPGVQALSGVSFDLFKGEVHALVGENGAGKSTLMKILSGVEKPDAGTMTYEDRPVAFHTALEAQKAGIGIIFQELNLVPDLTVAQNIFIGREPLTPWGTIDEPKMRRDAVALLASVNVSISPDAEVRRLPVSVQQMVEIAKVLSQKSRVLIMDEPTSALTESEITALFKVIHALRDQGVGIIYISHRLEELQHIVDRISILRDGQLVGTSRYSDISLKEVVNLMVGRKLEKQFPPRGNAPTTEVLLEVRGLRSGDRVKDVSFQLFRGEILGFSGLMGAGRTETARALFGADAKDAGEIFLNGTKISTRSPSKAIRQGIAYLPENRKQDGLAVLMNVAENITMANVPAISRRFGVLSAAGEHAAAKHYTENLQIKTPRLDQKVNNLSGGNQQKVVVGKWLFNDSKILIFDEPTRGIDVGAKYAVYQLMESLARQGVGVIMISSELPEILGMTDRVVVLHEGRQAATLVTAETTQEEILSFAAGLGTPQSPQGKAPHP